MICSTLQMNAQREHTEMHTCLPVLVVMRTLSVLQEHLLVLLVMLDMLLMMIRQNAVSR